MFQCQLYLQLLVGMTVKESPSLACPQILERGGVKITSEVHSFIKEIQRFICLG